MDARDISIAIRTKHANTAEVDNTVYQKPPDNTRALPHSVLLLFDTHLTKCFTTV